MASFMRACELLSVFLCLVLSGAFQKVLHSGPWLTSMCVARPSSRVHGGWISLRQGGATVSCTEDLFCVMHLPLLLPVRGCAMCTECCAVPAPRVELGDENVCTCCRPFTMCMQLGKGTMFVPLVTAILGTMFSARGASAGGSWEHDFS